MTGHFLPVWQFLSAKLINIPLKGVPGRNMKFSPRNSRLIYQKAEETTAKKPEKTMKSILLITVTLAWFGVAAVYMFSKAVEFMTFIA